MNDDFKVSARSEQNIAATALAWRDTLGVSSEWAPNVINLLELAVPKFIKNFALVVRPDVEMGDAEAYTEFDPPTHRGARVCLCVSSPSRRAKPHDFRP